jgi:hypothetical protein
LKHGPWRSGKLMAIKSRQQKAGDKKPAIKMAGNKKGPA